MTMQKHVETITYATGSGLTVGGWLMQHLPSPDVTAQLASWVGIAVGIITCVCTVFFKWRNSRLYKKALEEGHVVPPDER